MIQQKGRVFNKKPEKTFLMGRNLHFLLQYVIDYNKFPALFQHLFNIFVIFHMFFQITYPVSERSFISRRKHKRSPNLKTPGLGISLVYLFLLYCQIRISHEAFIHFFRRLAPFADRPHNEGLTPVHIACNEHILYICRVFS